tara:strand:+ start:8374 stop:9387 length:1014 start_codon:yes stop_codon:yes gene_type:complete
LKKYSGKKVAVLWSGGFDSTFLALQLAKAGAHVVCIYDTSGSLSKLGDVLNRGKVTALLEDVGVKFQEFKTEHPITESTSRYSHYASIIRNITEYAIKVCPSSIIATGVLGSDMQCNEIVELLEPYEAVHPLKGYSYSEYRQLKESACEEHDVLARLSRCDNGQLLNYAKHTPCSVAKPRELWCFKCHESGAKFVEETYEDQHLVTSLRKTYPDATIGWLLGHIVAGEADERPRFAARMRRFKPGKVVEGDFPVTLRLREPGSERWKLRKQRRFAKVETVNIWLSDLKIMMGDDITQPLIQNSPVAANLIKELVEQNYLPVGYEWDIHEIEVLWSAE